MKNTNSPPKPPTGLGTRGRKLWRQITGDYELSDTELTILYEAGKTLDAIDLLDLAISESGATVVGSQGQQVVNGALTEIRGQRALFHKLIASIDLPEEDSVRSATSMRASTAANHRWSTPAARSRRAG